MLFPVVVFSAAMPFIVDDVALGYAVLGAVVGAGMIYAFVDAARDAYHRIDAGAHTLAEVDEYGNGCELNVYDLVAVAVADTRYGLILRLVERSRGKRRRDRDIGVPLGLLEGNQQLRDLVYNGIRHSAADGAVLDTRTRELLALQPT